MFKTIELNGSEDTYTWADLEKYDEHGAEYTYTVDEVVCLKVLKKSVGDNVLPTNTTEMINIYQQLVFLV